MIATRGGRERCVPPYAITTVPSQRRGLKALPGLDDVASRRDTKAKAGALSRRLSNVSAQRGRGAQVNGRLNGLLNDFMKVTGLSPTS
jgi:hypothetical protein